MLSGSNDDLFVLKQYSAEDKKLLLHPPRNLLLFLSSAQILAKCTFSKILLLFAMGVACRVLGVEVSCFQKGRKLLCLSKAC